MRKIINILLLSTVLIFFGGLSNAQVVNVQWGDYVPGSFMGYGNHPNAAGSFFSAIGKTGGPVAARTAIVVLTLAPEVPWDGSPIVVPTGWEVDNDNTTPTNIVIINSVDWVSDEPFFEIPVRAIARRSSTLLTVGTQVFNDGGLWVLHPDAPDKFTSVTVDDNALPVVLVSFTATAENATSALQWTTTSETNSDQFEVERSQNGKTWNKIGTVTSSGESNVLKNYFFTDSRPANGENLYRLKMIDLDGTFAYSTIRSLIFDNIQAFVYPNPTSDKLFIKDFENVKNLIISNLSGMKVLDMKQVPSDGIDIKHLSPGIHTVSLILLNGTPYTHKFVVSK